MNTQDGQMRVITYNHVLLCSIVQHCVMRRMDQDGFNLS